MGPGAAATVAITLMSYMHMKYIDRGRGGINSFSRKLLNILIFKSVIYINVNAKKLFKS